MLVLSNTDRLSVNLYQLSQRINQSSTNRNSSSNRYIVIRKFLSSDRTSTINRGSIFRNNKNLHVILKENMLNHLFCFSTSCSVSNSYRFNIISFYQLRQLTLSFCHFLLWWMWINRSICQQFPCFINTNHFTSRSISWVNG